MHGGFEVVRSFAPTAQPVKVERPFSGEGKAITESMRKYSIRRWLTVAGRNSGVL